jgi:hypothetical protein
VKQKVGVLEKRVKSFKGKFEYLFCCGKFFPEEEPNDIQSYITSFHSLLSKYFDLDFQRSSNLSMWK